MDEFNKGTLLHLSEDTNGPCMSLFQETHPFGKDGEQDAIRLRNLICDARRTLESCGTTASNLKELLEQAEQLPADLSFWGKREKGLAVFASPSHFSAIRVPISLPNRVTVANRFRLRPLLSLLELSSPIWLLALSQNRVGLYVVNQDPIHNCSIEQLEVGMPEGIKATLNYAGADRGSQAHTAQRGGFGKQAAVFHGQGGQRETTKADRLSYCAEVDKAVSARLAGSKRPMLLACVESLAPLYRRKNTYEHLLSDTLTGNYDRFSEPQLCAAVEPIVKRQADDTARIVARRFADQMGTSKFTDNPIDVIAAAFHGQIETLIFDPKAELFGRYLGNGAGADVTGKPTDDDLIDLAAIHVIRNGGIVHSMSTYTIPTNAPLAATLRY